MALENLTTWTEDDPNGRLTVTSTSITINDLAKGDGNTFVSYDFGAGYWSGDWEVRFKYTTPASGESDVGCWVYPCVFANSKLAPGTIEGADGDFQSVIYSVGAGPVAYLYLDVVEDGDRNYAIPDPVSFETTYYITLERDDDGGVNNTGQITLRIYTGNYYGESGAVEHDTVTQDCGVGEQNDFRYIMLAAPRGSGVEATDGLIENVDLDPSAASYVELSGTVAAATAVSGAMSITTSVALSGTIAATASLSGALTISNFPTGSGGKANTSNLSLVAFGNNRLYYEDT